MWQAKAFEAHQDLTETMYSRHLWTRPVEYWCHAILRMEAEIQHQTAWRFWHLDWVLRIYELYDVICKIASGDIK